MKFGLYYDLRFTPKWSGKPSELYNEFLDQCEMVEELGYDCIWLCEHHYDPKVSWIPSALTLAAAVAARTKRIKIGTGIIVLPQHDPVRVAEAATVLDYVSNGRFRLGVAVGYRVSEFRADNIDRSERVPRLIEGIKIIQSCWTEDKFSYDGRFRKITDMEFAPKPVSKPHPPIYVGGGGGGGAEGTERAANRAASLGCNVLIGGRDFGIAYHKALKKNGHDPSKFEMAGGGGGLWVSDDPEKDWEEVKEHVMIRNDWYLYEHMQAGQRTGETDYGARLRGERARFVDVSGAIEHVDRLIKEVPQVTEMVRWAGYPDMPLSRSVKSLELFARKVMPRFLH
ncbi:MAG: LLM class flavin-dependent oxidoreductase [Chloroflexi bacterium]|nr:LLM class flavin-dependent oxidoreductase [Chloroflexota bacterium]